ncbi:ABC transporter ATP-binding protein [Aminipila sp.]|uniref:ABC transporter ATP-binding protein n=1 Tax=Aminipila sp. TaxID=2060095 RepID=UPI00289BD5D1|nr:energy-coupling factor ABC transporter ATP-binding protein [Aminipila sp.]
MIEIKNVSFTYAGGKKDNGLSHINLNIRTGEILLICGESGCGKTTLTRLINGLIPYYYEGSLSGQVLIDGEDMSSKPLYETAKKVASVFQNPRTQFYNVETTSEIVFALENMGLPENEILSRLDQTNKNLKLQHLLNRSLFALSGGEKQKIACASADAINPEIVVLDEPSSNLDISTIQDLKNIVVQWKNAHKTVIVAEHRLYYLAPLADRILYMKNGKIQQEFTAKEFSRLSPQALLRMGLRSLNPFSLKPEAFPNKEKSFISFKNFNYAYKRRTPLQLNIPSLELPSNEIIGIIGNNGAGKSTFARCLCGLDKSAQGKLTINNKNYATKQRRKLTYMVMQDVNHQLFTESILDEILLSMEGAAPAKEEKTAQEVLQSLDLIDKQELHPMSLSGGEKQRVAIGSAIASHKEILIFDEPTSGLDYRHMLEVSDNLKSLQNLGKTIFIITHDPELIYKCCTYILFIHKGSVLWHRPMDAKTQRLLADFFSSENFKVGG